MGHAVLAVALGSGQLVVTREFQLVILNVENRIRAPLVWIVRATARSHSTTPLVREHNFLTVIRKRSRMPVCVILVVYCIETFRVDRIFDVQQDSVSVASTGRDTEL